MECEACGFEFEIEKPMPDPLPKKCPSCKKNKARQVYTKPPAYHNKYSPMHPRVKRGRGW